METAEMYDRIGRALVEIAYALDSRSPCHCTLAGTVPQPGLESPEPADTPVIQYVMPGAPSIGRRVVWTPAAHDPRREPPPPRMFERTPDGTFEEVATAWRPVVPAAGLVGYAWPALLERFPVLTLVPLTDEEQASETLYGPIGARWGNPDVPCHYVGCALGDRHVGPHRDGNGEPIGMTEADGTRTRAAAVGTLGDVASFCTCGRPGNHQPGCPRYERTTGV